MNTSFITTNIRLPEEDYMRLKAEAAKKRKSFAAIVRIKLASPTIHADKTRVARLLRETERIAAENAKVLKGWDSTAALREIRYHGKW